MIDIQQEQILSLAKAARWWSQRTNQVKHPSTLWRWATRGVLAADGTRIRLEVAPDGRSLKTSVQALQRLCDRLAEIRATVRVPEPVEVTARQARRAHREAVQELELLGA